MLQRVGHTQRYVRTVALLGVVALLQGCGDDDAAPEAPDASPASDAAVTPPPTDAGADASVPRLDAGGPSDAAAPTDAGVCTPPVRDDALAASLCACEEPDGSTWPFVHDDAGVHTEPFWRVSLECVCALGHCPTLAQVALSGQRWCGCGRISVSVFRGFNPTVYVYDLATLELVGVRVGGSDNVQSMCEEDVFVAGEIDLDCTDPQPTCDLPASVVPCPVE